MPPGVTFQSEGPWPPNTELVLHHVLAKDIVQIPKQETEGEHPSTTGKECADRCPLVLGDFGHLFGPLEQVCDPKC
jgi:hypothetical protein